MFILYRPGLLGKSKYEFAKTYCDFKYMKGIQGNIFAVIRRAHKLFLCACFSSMCNCVYMVEYYVQVQLLVFTLYSF